jgi:hypothetical protein
MVTISSILASWLTSRQEYMEGVDIFKRLSNDKARLAHFLRFHSHMTISRLTEEIEKLYSKAKEAPGLQSQELDATYDQVQSIQVWLDLSSLSTGDNMSYFEGVDLLESITGDHSMATFFNHHISEYGRVQLRKALESLLADLEKLIALRRQKDAAPVTTLDHIRAWLESEQNYVAGGLLLSKLTSNPALISLFNGDETPYTRARLQTELERLYDEQRRKEKQDLNVTGEIPAAEAVHSLEGALETPLPAASQLATQEQSLLDPGLKDSAAADTDPADDDSEVPDVMLGHTIENLRKSLSKLRLKEQTPERLAIIKMNETRLQTLLQRKNSLIQAN